MSATEILDNSHLYAIQTLDDLNEVEWDIPGVDGDWSVKDIVAHLTSYEHLLLEILQAFAGQASDKTYSTARSQGQEQFNASQVEQHKYNTAQQVMDEYQDVQTQTSSLLAQLPADIVMKPETIPLRGKMVSMEQSITGFVNHTRTHCDQIRAFRQRENQ